MPGFFTTKPQRYVGIEVGAQSINMVELSRSRSGIQLEAYAIEPLPAMPVHDLTGIPAKSVAQALLKALGAAGVQARDAVMSMPDTQVISKVIRVEADLSTSDLELHVRLEAEQYVPYSLDEAALDFDVLGVSDVDPQQLDVLLVVCRQETLDWHQAVLLGAGLNPRVIEVQSHALARGLEGLSRLPGYEVSEPLAGIKRNPRLAPDAVFCDAAQLLTACGLALRGFD